ncbi:hypothetical protein K1719_000020 [Acacia pycnantha]|nr:hypothetical protein K1719_000020 [Acacia pycnantha]
MSHITVERNRRRQMNEHLTPLFFLSGDQASIIGGVIEFIKELHQVVEVLESKKRRRKSLSHSPRTPLPPPPAPATTMKEEESVGASASSNSSVADVQVKISGSNVILRVISHKIVGQVSKIISVLERLSFEVLHLNISSMEDTVLYQFVLKIGLECQLSLEELAVGVQQTFCDQKMLTSTG